MINTYSKNALLLLTLTLISCGTDKEESPDMAKNAAPIGYEVITGTWGVDVDHDDAVYKTGNSSVKILTAKTAYLRQIEYSPVSPGDWVQAYGWVKPSFGSSGSYTGGVYYYTAAKAYDSAATITATFLAGADWLYVRTVFQVPSGCYYMRALFGASADAAQEIWWDSWVLSIVPYLSSGPTIVRPAASATTSGRMFWDTTLVALFYCDGSNWIRMAGAQESITAIGGGDFANSWVNYDDGYEPAGYWKDSLGIVHVRGLIKSGTSGQSAFTLPAGYRPPYPVLFPADSNGAFGAVRVLTDGKVVPYGSNTYFSLASISFRV